MKKNRLRNLLTLVGIFLFIIVIGGTLFRTVNRGHENKNGTIIKNNVSVITAETKKNKLPIKVTDNELIFKDNPKVTKGDVIVAGILDSAPSGFIRKVIGTTKKDNQYIVKTEYGVLTDVFEKVSITKTFALTKDGAKEADSNSIKQTSMNRAGTVLCTYPSISYTNNTNLKTATPVSLLDNESDYQFAKEFEYDLTQGISAKGAVGFNIGLQVEIIINHGNVVFGIVAHNESGGTINIGSSADADIKFDKELFGIKLPDLQFYIGVIPIVITNEIQSDIEGEARIQGSVGTTFKIQSENSSGFQYSSKTNKVKEIKKKKYLSDGLQWDTGAKFSGGNSAGVYLHLISKLYDSTGADIAVGIVGEAEGKVSVSPKKSFDGLNYVGSIDLKISPKLQGSLVVSVPVIDEKLTEMQLFEMKLEPFWKKHWDSGENWEKELQSQDISNKKKKVVLNNTYQTRYGKVNAVTCPQFQFDYSDNWKVTKEDTNNDAFGERDVLTNDRGTTITYMSFATMNGLGNDGRTMYKVEASKVVDSSFVPTIPDGTDSDYSKLGNFIVAKLKIVGDLNMDKDSDYTAIDGGILYAVLPESYVGMHEVVGKGGLYDEFSFKYPSPYAFIAEAPDGKFTVEEEKEVIAILASFKN